MALRHTRVLLFVVFTSCPTENFGKGVGGGPEGRHSANPGGSTGYGFGTAPPVAIPTAASLDWAGTLARLRALSPGPLPGNPVSRFTPPYMYY